jgi:hypothetical protein
VSHASRSSFLSIQRRRYSNQRPSVWLTAACDRNCFDNSFVFRLHDATRNELGSAWEDRVWQQSYRFHWKKTGGIHAGHPHNSEFSVRDLSFAPHRLRTENNSPSFIFRLLICSRSSDCTVYWTQIGHRSLRRAVLAGFGAWFPPCQSGFAARSPVSRSCLLGRSAAISIVIIGKRPGVAYGGGSRITSSLHATFCVPTAASFQNSGLLSRCSVVHTMASLTQPWPLRVFLTSWLREWREPVDPKLTSVLLPNRTAARCFAGVASKEAVHRLQRFFFTRRPRLRRKGSFGSFFFTRRPCLRRKGSFGSFGKVSPSAI